MAWTRRTELAELMDDPSCTRGELRRALCFLRWLNRVSLAPRILAHRSRPGRVLDVATGGADIPAYMRRRGVARLAVGLDKNPAILELARDLSPDVHLVRADCSRLPFAGRSFDTAVCHLFFHHLNEEDCVALLREMSRVARSVVVLDLSRNRWLHVLVWVLTRFSRSRLARFDGPLSVRRSYTVPEVKRMLDRSGIEARVERALFWRWTLRLE